MKATTLSPPSPLQYLSSPDRYLLYLIGCCLRGGHGYELFQHMKILDLILSEWTVQITAAQIRGCINQALKNPLGVSIMTAL